MKLITLSSAVLAGLLVQAQAASPEIGPTNIVTDSFVIPPAPPTVSVSSTLVESGANHAVWRFTTLHTNGNGRVITRNSAYQELGTSLNHLVGGQWIRSSDEVSLTENGGVAANSAHRVAFAADASANSAIQLTLPSGETLTSHVICLSYADTLSGSNVMIAQIRSSTGLLLPGNNRVLYTNALSGDCDADILYKNDISGLEQNVILRSRVSEATVAQYGLNPASTVLQVWTAFTGGPTPRITPLPGRTPSEQGMLATAGDIHLDFGSMTIGAGTAFLVGEGITNSPVARVTKDWVVINNQRYLVEQIPLNAIAAQLQSLPAAAPSGTNAIHHAMLRRTPFDPAALALRPAKPSPKSLHLAAASFLTRPGFLVDYSILSSQTNLTIHTGETYLINGIVNVCGTLVIEGGAVVKFDETNNASIIATNVIDLAQDYLPTVFTSKFDNSVGDSTGSGSPTNYAASVALDFSSALSPALSHLRFSYLSNAIAASTITLQDVQILNCQAAIAAGNLSSHLRNVLAYNVQTFIDTGGEGYVGKTVSGENMTVHQCPNFLVDTNGSISLTNCVFVGVTNWQCLTTSTNHSAFLDSAAGVFRIASLGNYYLATNSPYLDAGTASINTNLLNELRQKTTFPPVIYSNVYLSGTLTLSPQVQRDTNDIDMGFHYPALDFIFCNVPITNGTVTVQAGTAIGTRPTFTGYGLTIGHGSSLQCLGDPANPVRIASVKAVQEQPVAVPGAGYNASIFTFAAGSGGDPAQGFFRFTKWSTVGRVLEHFDGYFGSPTAPMNFEGCEFYGGSFRTYGPGVNLTNCLFEEVSLDIEEYNDPGFQVAIFNSLFHGGDIVLGQYLVPWIFLDNVFDRTTFGNNGGPNVFHHNAYISTADYLASTLQPGDVLLSNMNWITGPLGNYYQPTNSSLLNVGSGSAGLAGLYYWTVTTNALGGLQIPESNSVVDIGLHYLAVDATTNFLDYNANGIPDYLDNPDTNTNGLPDYWEIQYFGSLGVDPNADADLDGLSNLQEYQDDTNPLTPNAPALLAQPRSQTVFAGSNVTFTVTPIGVVLTNYTFQWRRSSQPIAGATTSTLVLSNVAFPDPANYSVIVSNIAGAVASHLARLTVWTPGTVNAWGRNNYGQTNVPAGLTNVVEIAAGILHNYALTANGTLVPWGSDDPVETNTPALSDIAVICTAGYHNIALGNNGTVATWGWPDSIYPGHDIPASCADIVSVAAGHYHMLALRSDGTVVAWGSNTAGQTNVPASATNVVAIAAGPLFNVAVKGDGTLLLWGDYTDVGLPVPGAATNAVAACAGYDHIGIIRSDGTALVWGGNSFGDTNVPLAATNLAALVSGEYFEPEHLMALRRDGTVFAWGRNDYGQTDVSPWLNDFGSCAIAAGQWHSLALYLDSDRNGLPDWWELLYFGHIGVDPNADPDGDGVTNLQEFQQRLNPLSQSTRGDGVIDQAFRVIITKPSSNSNLP